MLFSAHGVGILSAWAPKAPNCYFENSQSPVVKIRVKSSFLLFVLTTYSYDLRNSRNSLVNLPLGDVWNQRVLFFPPIPDIGMIQFLDARQRIDPSWKERNLEIPPEAKKKKLLEVWDRKGVGKAFKLNTVLGPMMPLAHGDGYILAGGWDASAGQESPGQTYIGTSEPSDSRCVFKVFVSTHKKKYCIVDISSEREQQLCWTSTCGWTC